MSLHRTSGSVQGAGDRHSYRDPEVINWVCALQSYAMAGGTRVVQALSG